MAGVDPAGLCGPGVRHVELPLQIVPARPGPLAARIKAICETRVRYGYRRVDVLLRREGWHVNQKRIRRIYNELGLQLGNKTPKRRVKAKLREDRAPATRPNDVWAMELASPPFGSSTTSSPRAARSGF